MVKPAGPFLAPGAPGKALLHRKGHSSTPRTKTCPFTPTSNNRSLGTPNPWGPRLLLGKLGLAHVGKESGMGRAALGKMGAGLDQAEGSVHCQADLGGVAVLLAVILPPADGAQGQCLGRLQRLVSATWTTKTGHHNFPHKDWTATAVCGVTRSSFELLAFSFKMLLTDLHGPSRTMRFVGWVTLFSPVCGCTLPFPFATPEPCP